MENSRANSFFRQFFRIVGDWTGFYVFVMVDNFIPINVWLILDVTLLICPGIGNNSETIYVRAFVHHAVTSGYRCAVLNHLGTLETVKLTSPKIFGYGKFLFTSMCQISK